MSRDESEAEYGDESKSDFILFHEDDANTFSFNLFDTALVLEQNPSARDLGHGAVVWEASAIFAKYMEHNTKQFTYSKLNGKTVLELGSGCGLGGIAFMMRGANVIMTDLECVTEALTRPNSERVFNRLTSFGSSIVHPIIRPVVMPLDWTLEYTCPAGAAEPPYDIVLLTDCVFSVELSPALVKTIKSVCGPRTDIYCCYEIRDEHIQAVFLLELSKLFSIKRISRSKLHPSFRNDMVELIICKLLR